MVFSDRIRSVDSPQVRSRRRMRDAHVVIASTIQPGYRNMKRLNVKLVAVLVTSTIVLSGATYAIHDIQVGNNADNLRVRGDEAKALGKEAKEDGRMTEAREHYRNAVRQYSRYLVYRRKNDEHKVLVELANVYTDIAELPPRTGPDVMMAIGKLEDALADYKEEHELRRRLAKYLMGFGRRRIKDAVVHWEQLVEYLPEDADARFQLARCYRAQDRIDKAIESLSVIVGYDVKQRRFDRSSALAADMINAYDLLAIIIRKRREDDDLADRIMEEMIAANADDHNAYLHRASYFQLYPGDDKKQDPRAEQDIRKAQSLAGTDANVLLAAAGMARKTDKYLEARGLLTTGKQLYPKDSRMYLQLARLHLSKRQVTAASEEINQGLKNVPDNLALLLLRAESQLQLGDKAGLLDTKADLEKAGIPTALLDFVDAMTKVLEGKWFAASQTFERGRRYWNSDSAQLRQIDRKLALCYGQMAQPDLQLTAIGRVLSQGDDLATRSSEIQALISLGRTDQARARLMVIKEKNRAAFYANLYATQSFWRRLLNLEQFRQLRKPKPQRDWRLVNEIVGIVQAKRAEVTAKMAKALDDAVKLKNASPDAMASLRREIEIASVAATQLSAGTIEAQGDPKAAQALLDKAAQQFPDNYTLQKIELNRIQRAGGPAAALSKIDELQAKFPAFKSDLKRMRINLIVRQNDKDTRARLVKIEADVNQISSLQQKQAFWSVLASAYQTLRDYDETRRLMRLVADSDPDNPKHVMQQFEIARATGNEEWMQEVVDDLKRRDMEGSGSSQLLYAQAALEVGRFRKSEDKEQTEMLDRAREFISQARIVRPDWHKLSQLVGEIDHLELNVNEAIKGYQQALEQGPPDIDTINRLVSLLSGQRRYADALEAIGLLGDSQRNPSIQRAKAKIYTVTGHMKEALEAAKYAVSIDSEKYLDHLWYGNILAKAGKLVEAEAAFRRAVERGFNLTAPWLDLITLQLVAKQRLKAEATIREAQLRLPEDVSLPFMAKCYRLLGNQKLELQFHREHLERNPDNLTAMRGLAQFYLDRGKKPQTKAMLYQIMLADAAKTRTNYRDKKWARQLMARLLAVDGDYQQVNRALKILQLNALKEKLSLDDRLLKARLLARRPEPGSRQQAIAIFEQLKDPKPHPSPLATNDKLTMARLYERAGKWLICRETMVALLADYPKQPLLRVQYIQMLLRNGEAQQVSAQLARLREVPKMRTAVIRLQATMLFKLNRSAEATAGLLNEIQRQKSLNAKTQRILVDTANLLVQFEQHAAAEKLYREYAAATPKDVLVLAYYLAVHSSKVSQVDEAFAICDRLLKAKAASVQKVTRIGLAAISSNSDVVVQRHYDLVKTWIDRAERLAPDSRDVQLQLAQFYDALGEYRKSADIYERLIESPALKNSGTRDEALVLNNLAYVLADKLKQGDGGLERINRAISILGPQIDLLDTRATVYLQLDKPYEAIDDLKLALSDHNPGKMYMKYMHLAMAYQMADMADEGQDALRKGIDDGLKKHLDKRQREDYDQLCRQLKFNEGEAE